MGLVLRAAALAEWKW